MNGKLIRGIKVNSCGIHEEAYCTTRDLVVSLRLSEGGIQYLCSNYEREVTVNDETLRVRCDTEYAEYDGEKYPISVITLTDRMGNKWVSNSVAKCVAKYVDDKILNKAKYLKINAVTFVFTDKSLLDIVNETVASL